jgi:hypothetical protein
LSEEERDEACHRSVVDFFWNAVRFFKEKTNPAGWIQIGLNDAEEFLECLENGRAHPVLDAWLKRRSDAANRPAASSREQGTRRLVVLACH